MRIRIDGCRHIQCTCSMFTSCYLFIDGEKLAFPQISYTICSKPLTFSEPNLWHTKSIEHLAGECVRCSRSRAARCCTTSTRTPRIWASGSLGPSASRRWRSPRTCSPGEPRAYEGARLKVRESSVENLVCCAYLVKRFGSYCSVEKTPPAHFLCSSVPPCAMNYTHLVLQIWT